MEYGAVIVAAGMSTRMHQLKQLMRVGEMSMAERVVTNFQRAGIGRIVVVTGFRAQEVEEVLTPYGVEFVRNENYETTQMMDSAVLGLQKIKSSCERVFFCPVDVPLFTVRTVKLLMRIHAPLVIPVCGEKRGHPVVMDTSLIDGICGYQGEGGLKGAMDALPVSPVYIESEDKGAVTDADTQEDYLKLQEMLKQNRITPEAFLELKGSDAETFFTQETVRLLRNIENLGNMRDACQNMQISYSYGWKLIHQAENALGYRIVGRQNGGKNGGLSFVTGQGLELLTRFEKLSACVQKDVNSRYCEIFKS